MTEELERVKLQRELIAVRKRLENVRERLNQTHDPEEAADCQLLIDLHQRHENDLEAEINLPGLRQEWEEYQAAHERHEEAAHLRAQQARAKQIHPGLLPILYAHPLSTGRRHAEVIEFDIRHAEAVIRDWQCRLPEWKETYEYVRANFRARGVTPPDEAHSEEVPASPPLTVSGTLPVLAKIFPKSEMRRAFAQAVLELGAHVSPPQVCAWLDEHDGLLDLPEQWMTDGNDRSFATAYEKSSTTRHAIGSVLDKVKDKLRETGHLLRLN